MPVPNLPSSVAVTDTFEEWRLKTNSIIAALTNDTILLNELPSIDKDTILGNSSTVSATPNTITVLSNNGITMIGGALKLVTPLSIGGITMTNSGALRLADGVAGAGLALTNGALRLADGVAGAGLALTNGTLRLADGVAGAGLALSNGQLSVNSVPLTTIGTSVGTNIIIGNTTYDSPVITMTSTIQSDAIRASFIGRGITGNGIASLTRIISISGIISGSSVILSNNINVTAQTQTFTVYQFYENSGLEFVAASTAIGGTVESQITAGLSVNVNSNKGLEIDPNGIAIKVNNNSSLIVSNLGLSISTSMLTAIVKGIITNNRVIYTSMTYGIVYPATYVTTWWLNNNRRGRNLSPVIPGNSVPANNAGITWTRSITNSSATIGTGNGFIIAIFTDAPTIAITIGFSGRARGGDNNNNFGYLYLSRIIYNSNNVILENQVGLSINGSQGFYLIHENSREYTEIAIFDSLPALAVRGTWVMYILSYLADSSTWDVNETNDGQQGFHLFDPNRNSGASLSTHTAAYYITYPAEKKLSFTMLEVPTSTL